MSSSPGSGNRGDGAAAHTPPGCGFCGSQEWSCDTELEAAGCPMTLSIPLRYATVVADPPWEYAGGFNGFGDRRELPYPSMPVVEIATLPMPKLVDREGYLFLWTTNRYLPDAADLVRGWGFSYRQTLTWDKGVGSGGLGGMFATTSEFIVVAQNIRPGTNAHGSRTKRLRHEESVLRFPRQGRHSQKPEAFYDLVEQVSPGPYLDLFARRQRLGWDVWGDEVDSVFDLRYGYAPEYDSPSEVSQ